jgi:type II secretory pathway pseudopilin PulG
MSPGLSSRAGSARGFTLVELIVLIGIFTLLVTLSVPSFSRYMRSNRLATSIDRLAADLQMTRQMSIANGRIYRLVADPTGYTISDPLSGDVVRDRTFEGEVRLSAGATADFFPWGMADATVLNLQNQSGTRVLNILPTGVMEVH